MADVPRAMISSTTWDLPRRREQAKNACLRLDFLPKMMEHLPPSPDDAVRRSLGLVDEADVYVLILGLRYGEIPEGYDKSYTHLELDRAVERKIPIIRLLSDDDKHPFTKCDIDMGAAGERIVAELAARVVDPDGADIRARLLAAEAFEPATRLELARWIFRGGHPEAEPVLRELLGCPHANLRIGAVAGLSRTLDRADRRLLTRDMNGEQLFLDPAQPITDEWIATAVQRTGESVDQVRERYERLAEPFRLQLPAK